MSIFARTVASSPERLPGATWGVIVELLAPDPDSAAAKELRGVKGVACALISSESWVDDAAVVLGGPLRVRIYCVYGDAAMDGDGVNETSLPKCPTDGDWHLSLPCPKEDLKWVRKELANLTTRVSARVLGEAVDEAAEEGASASAPLRFNREEYFRS